jgi:hypothetical protein
MNEKRDEELTGAFNNTFKQLLEMEATLIETTALLTSLLCLIIDDKFKDDEKGKLKFFKMIIKRMQDHAEGLEE